MFMQDNIDKNLSSVSHNHTRCLLTVTV